jgi:hypothetical protein
MTVTEFVNFIIRNTCFADLAKFYDPTTNTHFYYGLGTTIIETYDLSYMIPVLKYKQQPQSFATLYYDLTGLGHENHHIYFSSRDRIYKPHIIK